MLTCSLKHCLSEFGPYENLEDAYTTLDQARNEIVSAGGGVLEIPFDAPSYFYPRTRMQVGFDTPAVPIIDYRGGVEHRYLPSAGGHPSDATGAAGGSFILERDSYVPLPAQGSYVTQHITSRVRGGASSYSNTLTRSVAVDSDVRFYVESHSGMFVGQTLNVPVGADGFGGTSESVEVKSLGIDNAEPYFIADTTLDHAAKAYVYNKNVINGLNVKDATNTDSQSMSVKVDKFTCGAGAAFVIHANLDYQGNIISGIGDEGGLCYGGDLVQDPELFRGNVESWSSDTLQLIYQSDGATNPQ